MKLIFEKSVPGRGQQYLPKCDVEEVSLPASDHTYSLGYRIKFRRVVDYGKH